MPTFGSLFAGIGGIDLGLERAGWECRFQVEIDPYCQHVLAHHWPDVPRYGDITRVDWSTVEPVDLIAGGFPCQPFSVAGQRRGKDDERWLWPEFARVVGALRPRYVLVENVPGLLAGHGGMGAVLGDLAELGYDAEWDSVPAAAVGAPHLRYRVWIVATDTRRAGLEVARHSAHGSEAAGGGQADRAPRGGDAPLADANGAGSQGRQLQPERAGERPAWARGVEDADPGGWDGRAGEQRPGRWGEPSDGGWWSVEPDLGRVADGLSSRLVRGLGLDDTHPGCLQKARAAGLPRTERLRVLWDYLQSPEAPSKPRRCALCGHPLSALPCGGTCRPWYLGARTDPDEDMRCLREGVYALGTREAVEALLARVPRGDGSSVSEASMARRVDKLHALGNAVVPQVVEVIGRRLMESYTE